VRPGDLLTHGCQESLRIEETRHPECIRAAFEEPTGELGVAIQQISKPEADGG